MKIETQSSHFFLPWLNFNEPRNECVSRWSREWVNRASEREKCPYHKFHIISPLHGIREGGTRRRRAAVSSTSKRFLLTFYSSSSSSSSFPIILFVEREEEFFYDFRANNFIFFFFGLCAQFCLARWVNKRGNNHIYLFSKQ